MKNKTLKTLQVCFIALVILSMGSCFNIINQNDFNQMNDNEGLVRIIIESSSENTINDTEPGFAAKTFYPASSAARYSFKFINTDIAGKVKEFTYQTLSEGTFSGNLETGKWTVEVTRYEYLGGTNYVPIAHGENTTPFEIKHGDNPARTVSLTPLGGTGTFNYSISVSGISATAALVLKEYGGAAEYTIQGIAANGVSHPINNIPAGNYDVFVSLTASDGRGTGAYSSVIIYPGLTTNGSFSFTNTNFVTDKMLEVKLNINKPVDFSLAAVNNVRITAINTANTSQSFTTNYYTWDGASETKIIRINPEIAAVSFKVEMIGDGNSNYDNLTYVRSIPDVYDIPSNGRENISLATAVYAINTSLSGPGTISSTRKSASPGETVSFTVTSDYGFRQGTLKVNNGAVTVSGSGAPSYSFVMPDYTTAYPNAVISADFFNANLSNLVITPSVTWDSPFTSGVTDYIITVPNSISSIQINPTKADPDVAMSISPGSIVNLPAGNTTVKITLTPPTALGGKSSKVYTLTVTRAKSNNADLASVIVDAGLNSYTLYSPYSLTVENAVSSVKVKVTTADSNAKVSIDGSPAALSYAETGNIGLTAGGPARTFTVLVTAEDGVSTCTYYVNVTRVAALSTVNTLNSIELSDGITQTIPIISPKVDYEETVNVPLNTITVNPVKTAPEATCVCNLIYQSSDMRVYSIIVTSESLTSVKQYSLTLKYVPEPEPEDP